MDDMSVGAEAQVLELARWYVRATRDHLRQLEALVSPLVRGDKGMLLFEEMRLGDRLDEAVYGLSLLALSVLSELRSWRAGLNGEMQQEVDALSAEINALSDQYKELMEATARIWPKGPPRGST